jgi:hypothetical protein
MLTRMRAVPLPLPGTITSWRVFQDTRGPSPESSQEHGRQAVQTRPSQNDDADVLIVRKWPLGGCPFDRRATVDENVLCTNKCLLDERHGT